VLIATPDHWHAVQTIHACEAGKHVFVEKPASVTVREGQAIVDAARGIKWPCKWAPRPGQPSAGGRPVARSGTASSAECGEFPAGTTPTQ
jgi:hypothetical protein